MQGLSHLIHLGCTLEMGSGSPSPGLSATLSHKGRGTQVEPTDNEFLISSQMQPSSKKLCRQKLPGNPVQAHPHESDFSPVKLMG